VLGFFHFKLGIALRREDSKPAVIIVNVFEELLDVQLAVLQQVFFDLNKFIELELVIFVKDGLIDVAEAGELDVGNDALSETGLAIRAVFIYLNGVAGRNALLVLVNKALTLIIVFVLKLTNSFINNTLLQRIVINSFRHLLTSNQTCIPFILPSYVRTYIN